MQRINRSAHAPVGTAFLLFLGLAIVPVSLRATGVRISFSPRLAAATDAWQQIAEVFGASYHPAPAFELTMVRDLDFGYTEQNEGCSSASAQESAELPAAAGEAPDAVDLRAPQRRRCEPRSGSRRSLTSRQLDMVVAKAIKARFDTQVPALGGLAGLKIVTLKRAEMLKNLDKGAFKPTPKPLFEFGNPIDSENFKVFINVKRAVAGSSARYAERKVFSALASARRRECDRASLTASPTENLDHSEF